VVLSTNEKSHDKHVLHETTRKKKNELRASYRSFITFTAALCFSATNITFRQPICNITSAFLVCKRGQRSSRAFTSTALSTMRVPRQLIT
jgi:hypothetical protein